MNKETFDNFFKPYSQNVDDIDRNSYFWKLSDKLILEIIKNEILVHTNPDSIVLDAGGGTGRWIVKMSKECDSKFILYDKSDDMLDKANVNISNAKLNNRVSIISGDLVDMTKIKDATVDHIVSIYSPISFVYDYKNAFNEMFRILKPGGKAIIMAHSYHNAIQSKINNYNAGVKELSSLFETSKVKWSAHVPELVTFSKETMENALTDAGFSANRAYGIPVYVQPGIEDFDPTGEDVSRISKYLSDENVFQKVFEIEMTYNCLPTVANRGMNMFILVEKK